MSGPVFGGRSTSTHNNRAVALDSLGRKWEALVAFDRALALDSDKALYHENRGIALENLGRYEEARASHHRASALEADIESVFANADSRGVPVGC